MSRALGGFLQSELGFVPQQGKTPVYLQMTPSATLPPRSFYGFMCGIFPGNALCLQYLDDFPVLTASPGPAEPLQVSRLELFKHRRSCRVNELTMRNFGVNAAALEAAVFRIPGGSIELMHFQDEYQISFPAFVVDKTNAEDLFDHELFEAA